MNYGEVVEHISKKEMESFMDIILNVQDDTSSDFPPQNEKDRRIFILESENYMLTSQIKRMERYIDELHASYNYKFESDAKAML